MRRLILLLTLTTGCAHGLDKSLDGIEKFAAGTRVALDESTKIWSAGVEAQVAYCQAKGLGPEASDADRAKCMGLLGQGEKAEPALDTLREGYDMLAEALKLLRQGADELQPFLEAAQEAQKRR